MAPVAASHPYPRPRPIMRPPPSSHASPRSPESDFEFFQRQLPNPFEPRIPCVLVPETQPAQFAPSGVNNPRPVGRILIPETQPHQPVPEINPTWNSQPSSQPISVPSSQPLQASTTIGQLASAKSKSSKARKPRKSTKAKGKEPERNPTPESDAHPGKKRRVEQLTEDDIAAASIQTIDQLDTPNIQNGTSRAKWTPEDILKHVTHWFSDENFTYAKNNQAAMYRQESEDLFKKEKSPQQVKDLHTRLLFKYHIANQVLSKTGGGDSVGDSEDEEVADGNGSKQEIRVKKRLLALGSKIGPASLIQFSKSEIYEKMDAQLRHCPETVKSFDMSLAREMTPSDNEDNGADSDVIVISDSDVEVVKGPIPPRKKVKPKHRKSNNGSESEDPTLDILANTVKGMGASQKTHNKTLQDQLAIAREQLAIGRAREQRENTQIELNRLKLAFELDAHQTQKACTLLKNRMEQTEIVARWQASGIDLLVKSADDFIAAFETHPLHTLLAPTMSHSISDILATIPGAQVAVTTTTKANSTVPIKAPPAPVAPAPPLPVSAPTSTQAENNTQAAPLPPALDHTGTNASSEPYDPVEESSADAARRNAMFAALADA
ncbi:hypothetical protein RSOL_049190, partial [Rhizoctonia solani AG-3 Rhs1AP]